MYKWGFLFVILIRDSQFVFHGLVFLSGFANVEFMVCISYQDALMRVAGNGSPIGIACCRFHGLDFLS